MLRARFMKAANATHPADVMKPGIFARELVRACNRGVLHPFMTAAIMGTSPARLHEKARGLRPAEVQPACRKIVEAHQRYDLI